VTARVVTASPGRTLGEVLRHSTAHITHTTQFGLLMANCIEPHEVHVDGTPWGFKLAAGKFTALSGMGVISQMLVTPHLEHLNWSSIASLSAHVRADLVKHGFTELDHKGDDLVKKSLATHEEDRSSIHQHGHILVELRWKVALRMTEPLAKFTHLKSDGLLLSVSITDPRLD
jgi:hypothetical protein